MSPVAEELAASGDRIAALLDDLDEETRRWRRIEAELDEALTEEWRTKQ